MVRKHLQSPMKAKAELLKISVEDYLGYIHLQTVYAHFLNFFFFFKLKSKQTKPRIMLLITSVGNWHQLRTVKYELTSNLLLPSSSKKSEHMGNPWPGATADHAARQGWASVISCISMPGTGTVAPIQCCVLLHGKKKCLEKKYLHTMCWFTSF